MKLWVDDIRDAPDDSWTEVRKVQPAISFLAQFEPLMVSLDHDIENRPSDETFKPVAYYMALKYSGRSPTAFVEDIIPTIIIHSDNPVGAKEMIGILSDWGIEATWQPFTKDADFKKKYGL